MFRTTSSSERTRGRLPWRWGGKEIDNPYLQGVEELPEQTNRRILEPALESAHIRSVDPSIDRKILSGEALPDSKPGRFRATSAFAFMPEYEHLVDHSLSSEADAHESTHCH